MAAAIGLYTAYQAATGEIDPSTMPPEKRDSLFKLSCVTPSTLADYTKYDPDIDGLDRHVDRERSVGHRARSAGGPGP